jgi:hypothetical protein
MTRAHETTASPPPAVTIINRPVWSREALRRAEPCRPVLDFHTTDPAAAPLVSKAVDAADHADHMHEAGRVVIAKRHEAKLDELLAKIDDPSRTCTLLVPDGKDEYSVLPAPDLAAAAAWLYGTPAPLTETTLAELLTPSQLTDCRLLLAQIGHALLNRTEQRVDELSAILQTGLRRRVGSVLVGPPERIYLYLLAANATLDTVQVCESCAVVFEAQRAKRCLACRRRPPRPTPRPWHLTITLPDRRTSQTQHTIVSTQTGTTLITTRRLAFSPRITYQGHCNCGCGRTFTSHDARRRYHDACATPAARTARHRAAQAHRTPNS